MATNAQLSLEAATVRCSALVMQAGGSATGVGEYERAIAILVNLMAPSQHQTTILRPYFQRAPHGGHCAQQTVLQTVKQRRSNELASHKISVIGAPVPPIPIGNRWRDSDPVKGHQLANNKGNFGQDKA